ncbi:MAG: hypothetical protein K6L74_16935, partial [Neptuniibacter sp.]
ADGSVGFPDVRVGHRQASNLKRRRILTDGLFFMRETQQEYQNYPLGYGDKVYTKGWQRFLSL